jgi:hypothetical protein
MPRFQTVVRRARFAYSPFTAQEMQGFAQLLADTIRARIQSGQNIYDQALRIQPPLPPYRIAPQPVRPSHARRGVVLFGASLAFLSFLYPSRRIRRMTKGETVRGKPAALTPARRNR